jgi:excisionase family DNA binding protein
MKLISSTEAAKKLGIHTTRVQVLIREGRLPAKLIGGTYVIDEADLKLVKDRKPGRPSMREMTTRKKRKKRKN